MGKRTVSILLLVCCVLTIVLCTALQAEQRELSDKLLRLHVVADSDNPYDQAVKLRVRDAVLKRAEELMHGETDPKSCLREHLPELSDAAEACLAELGCTQKVSVRLGKELFPTREYDTFALPAGVYDSLRVTLGSGRGHNWWCVIFPSICMTASMDEMKQAAVAAGLSDRELRLITESSPRYVLKFKALELLQKLKKIRTGT